MAFPRRKRCDRGKSGNKQAIEHTGFYPHLVAYLKWIEVRGYSAETNRRKESSLRRFIAWCDERGLSEPKEITKPILESYQRYLYHYRKPNGDPLTISSQSVFLSSIRSFFKWLACENYLLYNPASELVLPKRPKRLPEAILSEEEIVRIMEQPDISTPEGIRDRAILELFYCTGIRRTELLKLQLQDIDIRRLIIHVREAKGGKNRVLPVSERVGCWLRKYQLDVRPKFLLKLDESAFFLCDYGEAYNANMLGSMVKKRLKQAGIECVGGCHLFRHACATHMMEHGADLRFIQVLLGHEDLASTQIYTHVAVEKLRAVHAVTHPSARGAETQAEADSDTAEED